MEVSVGKVVAFCFILGILFKVYVYSPFEFIQNNAVIDIGNTNNEDIGSKNISLSNNVTIVTAFFDIGTLVKGNKDNVRSPSKYKEWMSIFRYIENPLYAYVDTIENLEAF